METSIRTLTDEDKTSVKEQKTRRPLMQGAFNLRVVCLIRHRLHSDPSCAPLLFAQGKHHRLQALLDPA